MKTQRTHIVVDTPAPLKASLQAIADSEHRTLSNLVKHILESYVKEEIVIIDPKEKKTAAKGYLLR